MTLQIPGHDFGYEMERLVRMFYPGERITVINDDCARSAPFIRAEVKREEKTLLLSTMLCVNERTFTDMERYKPAPEDDVARETERRLGVLLYNVLCEETGTRPPWGILTGVRPVGFLRKLSERYCLTPEQARDLFVQDYHVLPQKADLALVAHNAQQSILSANTGDSYSLYVGIPFCPTRCLYCSFVSHAIDSAGKLLPDYLALMGRELDAVGNLADKLGLSLRTIYIGGGTPTVLEPPQLACLLKQIADIFPTSSIFEYTVEAGRPDSISREKLEVLRSFGISRISINPQAMDDTILKAIGRNHTAKQVEEAFFLAESMGFDNINMDLILGLPGQTPESFSETLERVIDLHPSNITIHTLTVKRSSMLRTRPDAFESSPYPIEEMLSAAQRRMGEAGYRPYYLYRQLGTRQNLENTGFSLPGREGIYNVYSMEDCQTIFAVGAGGVTKLCSPGNRVKRIFNFKYPYEYIAGFDTVIERKRQAVDFYGRRTDFPLPGIAGI